LDRADLDDLIVAGRAATVNGDFARLIELDLRFHTHLYDAVGNRILS